MKISYDQATDSLYIHLADRASVESNEVQDGLVLDFDTNGALVGIDLQHASKWVDIDNLSVSKLPMTGSRLHMEEAKTQPRSANCTYFENDDILQIRLSDQPVERETSEGWHTNISYAEDGSVVEIVLLDAKKEGLLPVETGRLV